MKKLCPSASLLAVLFTVSTFAAHAYTDTNSQAGVTSSTFDSNSVLLQISNSDLIESGSSTLSSVTANNAADTSVIATSNAGINDGGHIDNGPTNYGRSAYYGYNSTANGGTAKSNLIVSNQLGGSGEIITFTLNTSINTLGYNISGLNSFAGWQDHASVADQNFTLSYSTVAAPATFITVGTIHYNPNDPTSDNPGGGG